MPEKPVLTAEPHPQAEPDIGAALWRLQDSRRRTLGVLRDVRPEEVDQETGGNSIGTILYHLALIEADWLYTEILERSPPPELSALLPEEHRDQAGVLTTIRGQSLEEHLARLHSIRETFLAEVVGLTTDEFHRVRDLPDYEVTPAWVLHHLAQHEAEHRGELGSMLARLRADDPAGTTG